MVTFTTTIRKSGNSIVVTIPKDLTDFLQLQDGTLCRFEMEKVELSEPEQKEGAA